MNKNLEYGKGVERTLARMLRGERNKETHGNDILAPSVANPVFGYEVKARKKLPEWLLNALNQAIKGSNADIHAVVLHEKYRHHIQDLVVLSIVDYVELLERAKLWELPKPTGE